MTDEVKYAAYRLSNETRARFVCWWCRHPFEASLVEFSQCPKCCSSEHCTNKCEVCGKVFREGRSGEGGRTAKVCSTRCRVRKHRVTKRGLLSADKGKEGQS